MHPTALALVVAAAVLHAGWNLVAKRASAGGVVFVWLFCTVSAALAVPAAVITLLLTDEPPSWNWPLAMVVSGALQIGYFVLLQRGYAAGDLSVVYPLARGTGPMLSVLAAVLLIGERPGVLALVGAAVVVAGIAVIGGIGSSALSLSAGMLYGIATGAMIACYTLWDAHAVTTLAVPPVLLLIGSVPIQFAGSGGFSWLREGD